DRLGLAEYFFESRIVVGQVASFWRKGSCALRHAFCVVLFTACCVVHFAARDSATDTSAAFRKCFLLSAKKILLQLANAFGA
ncbi:MAG: hypothetical protein M0R76_12685, partial [Proteobacteria bacterium]|nr:hypothetical protein [Pseudomonadota bacterium]